MLVVAFPTEYEAGEFVSRLRQRKKLVIGGATCYRGELEQMTLLVVICGMGKAMAAKRIKQVLAQEQAAILILAGFAGALIPELKKGQIIVADQYSSRDLFDFIRLIPGYDIARLHTADQVIATPEEKTALAAATGCQLVDMEMSAVAGVAESYGLEVLGVRVVSDEVDDVVPAEVLSHGYDQSQGKTTPLTMALYLLTHPWRIGELRRFLSPLSAARHALTVFLVSVVHELSDL